MSRAARLFLFLGALNALLVVIAGAYGAHAVRISAEQSALFQTAVQYHLFHALGLMVVGIVLMQRTARVFVWAGGLMLLGITFFCGALYLAATTGYRLGVAPAGGMAFMVAWLLLAIGVIRR